ncbi:MAG: hypothetical protein H0W90_13075 [Actinobacteria bacterium]|nr:hypothetical protein [Actinomycetota bacterium]
MELSLLGIRFFLGLLFLTTSLPKLAAPDDFRRALRNYQLLPFRLVRPVAKWLPRFELALALALLIGVVTPITASFAAAALLVFSAAVAINLASGRTIECGCFSGSSPRQITWQFVMGDIGLAVAAIAIAVRPPPLWTGSATIAVLLAALGALLVEQLVMEGARLYRVLGPARAGFSEEAAG